MKKAADCWLDSQRPLSRHGTLPTEWMEKKGENKGVGKWELENGNCLMAG